MTLLKFTPVLIIFLVLVASYLLGFTPVLIPVLYIFLSFIAFLVYARDKHSAQTGGWRTPESTLHLLALLSGWPGAIIAQQTLRHKTRKVRFRVIFWITVTVNLSALLWLHTPAGEIHLLNISSRGRQLAISHTNDNNVRKLLLGLFHTYDRTLIP